MSLTFLVSFARRGYGHYWNIMVNVVLSGAFIEDDDDLAAASGLSPARCATSKTYFMIRLHYFASILREVGKLRTHLNRSISDQSADWVRFSFAIKSKTAQITVRHPPWAVSNLPSRLTRFSINTRFVWLCFSSWFFIHTHLTLQSCASLSTIYCHSFLGEVRICYKKSFSRKVLNTFWFFFTQVYQFLWIYLT